MTPPTATPPPITPDHLARALRVLGWGDDWPLDRALADPVRGRIVRARAAFIRDREWQEALDREWQYIHRPKT